MSQPKMKDSSPNLRGYEYDLRVVLVTYLFWEQKKKVPKRSIEGFCVTRSRMQVGDFIKSVRGPAMGKESLLYGAMIAANKNATILQIIFVENIKDKSKFQGLSKC